MLVKNITLLFILLGVATCWSGKRMLQTDGFSDPLCAVFDQKSGDCISCICRAYFDNNRRCKAVDNLCQTWNINTGECTSCYRGYELNNGMCKIIEFYNPDNDTEISIDNPNCETSYSNGTCISCRPYYVLHCNDCQTTGENPFCSKFDSSNICVECDSGYELDVNNVCQESSIGSEDNMTIDSNGSYYNMTIDSSGSYDNMTIDSSGSYDNMTIDSSGSYDNMTIDSSGSYNNEINYDNETSYDNETNVTMCLAFENCLECNSTQCTLCEDGYRQEYVSKECVLPTTNCSEECALCSPNECFVCAEGYSSQSWPPCINCAFMYARNSEGKCKAIQSDCSAYPNCASCVVGECRQCNTGCKLDSEQKCVPE